MQLLADMHKRIYLLLEILEGDFWVMFCSHFLIVGVIVI